MQTLTKWCVFTGGPSSGKTTVLSALATIGFATVHEAARSYIESQLATGAKLSELRRDPIKFQNELLAVKLALENDLSPTNQLFLDRAMPDSIAYFELYGLDSTPVIELCRHRRYDRVFLFERLPLEDDNLRVENDDTAWFLHRRLAEVYQELGYQPIRVAVNSVEERVRFILDELKKQ